MKQIFSLICTVSPFLLFAQQKQFSLSGQIKGLKDNAFVYLLNPDNNSDTIAVGKVAKNQFQLKGVLPQEKLYTISISDREEKKMFFLDNSVMKMDGDLLKPAEWKITGSKSNDVFNEYKKTFDPYFSEYKVMSSEASKKGVSDSLRTAYAGMVNRLTSSSVSFTQLYKNSPVAPFVWITTAQLIANNNLLESQFNTLSSDVKASYYGQYLASQISDAKIGQVGTKALEFSQADTSGNMISLASFRGKYVLVDFWASWCGPCRQENPNVVAAFNKFKEKNFTVLGVSLDKSKERWIKAIKDDMLDWPQVSDLKYWQNEVAVQYKIQSIPQNILVDPNGVIVGRNLRGEDLKMKLCELLGCE